MLLETGRIQLRPVKEKDSNLLFFWRNSQHVADNCFSTRRITKDEHLRWFKALLKDRTRLTYIILLKKGRKPIGKIGLKNIDRRHRRAELEKLIGDHNVQGQGFATEAGRLFLRYVFRKLALVKIYAQVLEFNSANIRVNQKLGFKIEGRLRKHFFRKNKSFDLLFMGLLKNEFLKRQ